MALGHTASTSTLSQDPPLESTAHTAVPGGANAVNVTINDVPVGPGYTVWLVEAGTMSKFCGGSCVGASHVLLASVTRDGIVSLLDEG